MHPPQRRASRAAFASLAVFGLALRCFAAPAVTDPGYTISTLTSSLPSGVTGITADPATGTIYVGQQNSGSTAVAYSVTPAGVVTNLGTNTTTGYPYVGSDIQFLNGKLYTGSFSGVVSVRNATAGGGATAAYTVGGGAEMGVTTKNGYIYSTSGNGGSPQALYRYDPATGTTTTVLTGLPTYPSSLSADPTSSYLYFATYSSVSFHRINLANNTLDTSWSVTGTGIGTVGNFAVDPTGQFLFSKNSNTVVKISVATHSLVGTFVSGLTDSAYGSVCFGPSSSGGGYSLYIADATAIREVHGFPAPTPTVFASGISPVTAWDPIYPASALPDWTTESNPSGPSVGPNANWVNPHTASVFPKGTHPWENVPPMNFDAFWINAWSNITSQGPAGQSWTKYSTTVTGEGDFVLQFLADNVSWIYIDGNLIGYQAWNWDQVGTGRYTIHLSGAGSHELVFIIWDGGGAAGGKFRLETTQSFINNGGGTLPPPADSTPPVITAPSTITKEATSASGAVVTFTATANDAVSGTVPVTATPSSGNTFPIGISSVALSATDAAGNAAHATIVVNVQDTTAPVVTAPANVVAEATSASGAVVTYAAASATDAVGVTSLTYSPASGSTFPLGTSTVTATARDAAGNTGTGSFTITVRDTTAPALTLPANQTLEATSAAGAVATFAATATDAVGVASLTYSQNSGTAFALGVNTVTVTSKDAAGNTSTGTFTVTVRDTVAPALTVPANQTLEATGPTGAVATFAASATDAIGVTSLTYDWPSGTTFPLGTTLVTVIAKDAAGNSSAGTFTITVRDTTAPVLAALADKTVEATSALGAVVNFSATASDSVSGSTTVTATPASGSTFPLGTTTVALVTTDAAGNTTAGSFTVTVVDTTKPTLTLPADITAEATGPNGAAVTFVATATDAVGVKLVNAGFESPVFGGNTHNYVSFGTAGTSAGWKFTGYGGFLSEGGGGFGPMTQTAGQQCAFVQSYYGTVSSLETTNTFPVVAGATYTVTFSQATRPGFPGCTYNVTLNGPNGRTEIFRRTAASGEGWARYTATYTATTSGNCTLAFNNLNATDDATFFVDEVTLYSTAVPVVTSAASGSTFALGTTTVTATATDAAGNVQTGSFKITVKDSTAPVIAVPANITAEATSAAGAAVSYTATAGDIVSGAVAVTGTPTSGSTFALGTTTVALTATDAAGNTANASFSVTVKDTTAPVITAPADITAEATSAAGVIVTFNTSATDIVDGTVTVTASPASGSTFAIGSTTVTLTATDAAGNTATKTFNVKVQDTTAPALTVPANLTLEATGASGAVATFAANATDAVGVASVTYSQNSGTTFALGTTTVTVTAKDAAGNTSSGTFTVTVRDTTAPVIALPANQTLEATSAAGAAAAFSATANDIVSGAVTVSFSKSSGSTFALGVNTVTATAKDAAGNTATGTFTITVRDTTAPTIATPASIVAEATSAAGAAVSFTTSASDIVDGTDAVSPSKASGSTFALGTTTVTLTATDAAHNTATSTFTVTVRDTTAPALTLPASQTLEATSAAGAVANFAATATDAVGVASLTYSTASGSTFAIGTTTVTVTAKDAAGNATSGTFTITVRDTTAPTITSLTPSQATLWPPNHQMVAITLTATASDIVGVSSLKIVNVTSNEPDNGLGDGDTAGDIQVTGALTLNLRAERAGGGNGRIYTITVEARDAAGNATTRTTTVSVPKSQNGK